MQPSLNAAAPSETLLTPTQASAMLRSLSPAKIEALARKQTGLGTSDGPISDKSFENVISRASISYSSNKTWNMNVEIKPAHVKPLEYTVVAFPRSAWAFNVGPGGNFGQIPWKTGNKLPNGIELEVQPGRGPESDPSWMKTTRSPTDLELNWKVQLWNNQFTNPRTAEYTVSGRPVAWESAVDIHDLFDAKWTSFAKGRDDLVKKKANNGPATLMFLAARRSVFLPNVATQDEGRASEYDDSYKLLSFLPNTDLRFNRVPEVLIYNAEKKTYHPMSFHQLHRLGLGIVMLMTVAPIVSGSSCWLSFPFPLEHSLSLLSAVAVDGSLFALFIVLSRSSFHFAFSWGGKQHTGKQADMSWEYRLLNITVIGKREEEALCSPTKMVLKHKAYNLDLDDSGDERARKPGGSSKSASASVAASSASVAAASGGPSDVSRVSASSSGAASTSGPSSSLGGGGASGRLGCGGP
ncbi:hypothetical protein K438DRAFT_1966978 [Mycena galopus ATCC 62051]|nr:hypothetical protein K438DRAFT_1966978 [Mycena galopus ATCC 62051]